MNKKSLFDKLTKNFDHQAIWQEIGTNCLHQCNCDDRDGIIHVGASCDGDMHLSIFRHPDRIGIIDSFRARTYVGGGRKERVRKALMLLALAIKEDNSELND